MLASRLIHVSCSNHLGFIQDDTPFPEPLQLRYKLNVSCRKSERSNTREFCTTAIFPTPRHKFKTITLASRIKSPPNNHLLPSAFGINSGQSLQESSESSIQSVAAGIESTNTKFPWILLVQRFIERMLGFCWNASKWVLLPAFLVTTYAELGYFSRKGQLSVALLGYVTGYLLATGMALKSWEIEPQKSLSTPWHVVMMAFFFGTLKVLGTMYPAWGRVFFTAFATGGVFQTALYYKKVESMQKREWKQLVRAVVTMTEVMEEAPNK